MNSSTASAPVEESPVVELPEGVVTWLRLGRRNDRLPLPRIDAPGPLREGTSIVICTYRRPASLGRLLHSLTSQTSRSRQIIVVDASPDDESERVVRDYRDLPLPAEELLYFRVGGRLAGLTRQRNFALRWVTSDRTLFFDDDVVPSPSCLAELEEVYRSTRPQIVGVGAFVENELEAPSSIWRLRALLGVVPSLDPGRYFRSGVSTPWSFLPPTDGIVEGDWLSGCAMMWRTDAVREERFFDEFAGYSNGEDLELSLRMKCHGRLVVAGSARVRHLHEASGRPDSYELAKMTVRNNYAIHRRCIVARRRRDVGWFFYSCIMDVLIQAGGLFKGDVLERWRALRGRVHGISSVLRDPDPWPAESSGRRG